MMITALVVIVFVLYFSDNLQKSHHHHLVFPFLCKAFYISVSITFSLF